MTRGESMAVMILLLVLIATACAAQPIEVPPTELLLPPLNDFPRRGPEIRLEDSWDQLTAGENLALGKPYRFCRDPNYGVTRDDGDATDLTDGKAVGGDHIWYHKSSVGYAGAEPSPIICIDLGEVHAIDAIVAHVQGGGSHQAGLRYPLRFDVYVSDDDQTYHLVDSVSKRVYEDQPGSLFDLPESEDAMAPGDPHTHAFNFGDLATRGRYVALRMDLAGSYNALDEIAVMAGDHDPADVTFYDRYATELTFDGVELLYPRDWLMVPTNVAAGFSFPVRHSREDASQPWTAVIEMPAWVTLSWSGKDDLVVEEIERDGEPYRRYSLQVEGTRAYLAYFYISGEPGNEGAMRFHAECEGYVQPDQTVRLIPVEVPHAPRLERLFFAHGWAGPTMQMRWPDSPEAMVHLGFTHASVGSWETPNAYTDPDTAETQRWLDDVARPAGLKVSMVDSPFHIGESLWKRNEDFAEAYDQSDPPTNRLCLSYRGKYYQMEIERIVERYRYRRPDIVFFDIECFGAADKRVGGCARCAALMDERGCTAGELVTDLMAEISADIAAAINAAADELGREHPPIGYYQVGPGWVYHNIFDFAKMYPAGAQIANPEMYARCWPPAAAEIARFHKAGCPPGAQLITWTSPGTLNWEGECPPAHYFDAMLETLFNGASGTLYYTPINLSPGDLLAQAQVATIAAPVEDILAESQLLEGLTSDDAHVSGVRRGDEMLVLVADYRHVGETTVHVRVPVAEPMQVVDLFTGEVVGSIGPDDNELAVTISGAYRSRPFYIGTDWQRRAGE